MTFRRCAALAAITLSLVAQMITAQTRETFKARLSALPADGTTIKFFWAKWNSITLDAYRKKAFDMLAQDFAHSNAAQEPAKPARRPSSANKQGAH